MITFNKNQLIITVNTFNPVIHLLHLKNALINSCAASVGNIDNDSLIELLNFLSELDMTDEQLGASEEKVINQLKAGKIILN